ncbi:MAG: zf-HC2 domain-containing protein [Acidobacteriia bacterium]|nr:zf-HC2 domain-containing protein [Terriglobia bacterium]
MSCLPEMTCAIFVDEELPEDEARRVRLHLGRCSRCQALVDSLRVENRVLTNALQRVEEDWASTGEQPARLLDLVGKAAAVSILAVLLSFLVNWVEQRLPPATEWLNPMHLPGQSNLLFTIVFYLTNIGAAIMSQIVTIVSVLVSATLVITGGVLLWRHHKGFLRWGIGVVMLLVLVIPGLALERRSDKATVMIGSTETINDNLLATGDTILVDGVVNGDLIVFARRVEIHGTVKGDLVGFAQETDISGTVEGNVFGFSQSLNLTGHVTRNIYSWIQTFRLERQGVVGGDVVVGSANTSLDGKVTQSAWIFSGAADIRGNVGHDFSFFGGKLNLFPPASMGGDLTAHVSKPNSVHIAPGVAVGGKTETILNVHENRFVRPRFYFWKVVKLVGALLVGWLMLVLAPKFFHTTVQATGSLGRSLGLGFAVLVATPIAVIIACITLVGLPLGLLVLVFYVASLYFAEIFVGAFLGRVILRSSSATMSQTVLALLLGFVILLIVFEIPYGVGAILRLAVFCLGLGGFSWALYRSVRPQTN